MRLKTTIALQTLAACASVTLMAQPAFADHKPGHEGKSTMHHQLQSSSKLIGATVQDKSGQNIGTVQDLILSPSSGRVEFGLLSLNLPEHNGKVTAVPWQFFRNQSGNTFALNVDRDKLLSARMYDKSATLDFTEPNFGQSIYAHYGLNWNDRMSMGGRVHMPGGVETGVNPDYQGGTDDPKFKRPQPDGKTTFPQIDPQEKEKP
jgi:sporulation protein YlmC with PRC-barrel domain